jgi:hypothetical protein
MLSSMPKNRYYDLIKFRSRLTSTLISPRNAFATFANTVISIQVSKVVHLITSMEIGRLSRRRGSQPYARLLMRVESDFFHDHKIQSRNRNFGQHFFVTEF